MSTNYFDRINGTDLSKTGTGLDQLVDTMSSDLGLTGRVSDQDLTGGNQAANAMNQIIVDAITTLGIASDGVFSETDVRTLNTYIRANHLEEWTALHGDDERGEETGFHLIQNDGASTQYRGDNLTNTVADGIYHLGFEIQGNNILNEDGNANATIQQLSEWLTQFWTDHSTTQTGLDRMTDMVMADRGLDRRISDEEIAEGADAANTMNAIIHEAIAATNATEGGAITVDDVRALNAYIRANYQDQWVELHGDDEGNGEETGYHLVQNDGANTRMFGQNYVNTVADGVYHLGFDIQGDRILNEDGNANATLTDLADWLNFFYTDQGTTGTGLDELVDVVKSDRGLSNNTNAGDINSGAEAANSMNHILVEAIEQTGIAADKVISVEDVRAINTYIRANYLDEWTELHGDDERGEETGYHLVQNDGANEKYRGDNFVNTVIDGIYHLGFAIQGDNVLNEDGNRNANLGDLATWLNNFYLDEENTFGSAGNDNINTLNMDDKIWAREGNDQVRGNDGDDQVWGGEGNDYLDGGAGDDKLYGEAGNDNLQGRDGDDELDAGEGNNRLWGHDGDDTMSAGAGKDYLDGGAGNDTLSSGGGDDNLQGRDGNDSLDAGEGNNRLWGHDGNDTMSAGAGKDYMDGGAGNDTLRSGGGDDNLQGRDGDDKLDAGEGNNRLWGHDGDDTMSAGAGKDYMDGGSGDDALSSGAGDDNLQGRDGDDKLDAGEGNNRLWGHDGNDTLSAGAGKDYMDGGSGDDAISGGAGDDTLQGRDGNDIMRAGDGNDRMWGHDDDDDMDGGAGNDYMDGGSGDDTLVDGAGSDQLIGGKGDDELVAVSDGADDSFYGKDGADTFRFEVEGEGIGSDTIKDFSSDNGDKIVINGEGVEYFITAEGNNKHTVTLSSASGDPMGSISVNGRLSVSDISGTAKDGQQVIPVTQKPLPIPTSTEGSLDQLVGVMSDDLGLRGRVSDKDLEGGTQAAAAMNQIIVDAVAATGIASDGIFSETDVRTLNTYIRANHLEEWTALHGDDERGEETGFHLIQNDGASTQYRGDNLTNTVADGIYHLGFEIQGNNILNEDGNANATIQQLSEWLTQFWTDHSTTQTGLDRMTDMVMADKGLDNRISDEEIAEGADAANAMNAIIHEAIAATNATEGGAITVDDVRAINAYIRANYQDQWVELHGDDEGNGEETGYHLVQNDGAKTRMFGENFVNTVADGVYHLGFEIQGDRILNEDGNANATLTDLADWLNFFYTDQGTTGTGLDELVDVVKSDRGLSNNTNAGDINGGAEAANSMNHILVEAIEQTGIAADNVISVEDVRAINTYIRANYLDEWTELHGDDERGEETGYHLVQNDGAKERYRGDNFVNTVIDGIYHLGFAIQGDNVLNEDGNRNANLGDLATWLNNFYLDEENTFGSAGNDNINTLNVDDKIWAREGNDQVRSGDGDDQVWGGEGSDFLDGGAGDDKLYGEAGNDNLQGRDGDDELDAGEGNNRLWGHDGDDAMSAGAGKDYMDGGAGNDTLSSGGGDDNLQGRDGDDKLDAGEGNNRLWGHDGNDTMSAGAGKDYMDGGAGNDTLSSGGGDDNLQGRDGDDKLDAGEGNNRLWGHDGNDTMSAGSGKDYMDGGSGDDTLSSGGGDDNLQGRDGNDIMRAGDGNDRMWGHDDDDDMDGGAGNDYLDGGNGDDTLTDGAGADLLIGGKGDDELIAVSDGSNDRFYGKGGADTFRFGVEGAGVGNDTIHDFSTASGDELIIGGPDVSFEINQLASNRSLVTLTGSEGNDLGSITVYGDLDVESVMLDNDLTLGTSQADQANIA